MSEYAGNIFLAFFCTYLFVTNLAAICFIATDNNTNTNKDVVLTSYIGIGSSIVLAFIGACIYWFKVDRANKRSSYSSHGYGKRAYGRRS